MVVAEPAGAGRRTPVGSGPGRQAVAVAAGLVVLLVGSLLALLAEAGSSARASQELLGGPVAVSGAARDLRTAVQHEVLDARLTVLRRSSAAAGAPVPAAGPDADALLARITRGTADPRVRSRLDEVEAVRREVRAVVAGSAVVAADGPDARTAARRDGAARLAALDARQQLLLDDVVARLEAGVRAAVDRRATDSARRQQVVALVVTSGLVLLLVALSAVGVRVARPVRRVTVAARDAAERSLPSLAARVGGMPVGGRRPRLAPAEVGRGDAFGALAEAVTALQDSAVRLLVEQHEAQRHRLDVLLDVGRRCDGLLEGVLLDVAGLRRTAGDPDDATTLDGVADAAARVRHDLGAALASAVAPPATPAHQPLRVVDLRAAGDAGVRTG